MWSHVVSVIMTMKTSLLLSLNIFCRLIQYEPFDNGFVYRPALKDNMFDGKCQTQIKALRLKSERETYE